MNQSLLKLNNAARLAQQILGGLRVVRPKPEDIESTVEKIAERAEKVEDRGLKVAGIILVIDFILAAQFFSFASAGDKMKTYLSFIPDQVEFLIVISSFLFYLYIFSRCLWTALAVAADAFATYANEVGVLPLLKMKYLQGYLASSLLRPTDIGINDPKTFGLFLGIGTVWNNLTTYLLLALHLLILSQGIVQVWQQPILPVVISRALLVVAVLFNISAVILFVHIRIIKYGFVATLIPPAPPPGQQPGT